MRDLRRGRRLPAQAWRPLVLRWVAQALAPDVIHFPWNRGVVRPPRGCLTVLTLHDLIPLALPGLYFAGARQERAYRERARHDVEAADLVLTDSEASRQDIVTHLAPERDPLVVPLASSLPAAASAGGRRDGREAYFVYYGGYDIRKGLVELVRVYRKLYAARWVSGPLWMVGHSQVFSAEFGVEFQAGLAEGAVVDRGYLNDAQLVEVLQGARALVYPSHYEGFGLPPLEAMGLGCPVITTRVSSMPEVCGDAPLYVPPGDREALEEAILRLEREEALRCELGARGRVRARAFSWERSARAFLQGLDRLRMGPAVADGGRR
jgi:glycosyltransferase involved in cell wall biosynthesis